MRQVDLGELQALDRTDDRSPRIAFVMSRFPKLTETFILNEILAVERLGVTVEIYPLLRERDQVLQPGAQELAARAHYLPSMGRSVMASQLYFLRRRPRAYLGALAVLLKDTLGSPRFLVAGLALYPKIAHAARHMSGAGIEHVHCHFATHAALAGLVIRRLVGIPYSFTAHGSDIHIDRHMLCRKLAEASFAVTVAESNRDVMEAECGSEEGRRIRILHCGVDTALFRPTRSAQGDPAAAGPLSILSIGTLHEVKGQRYLLEACAILREMGVDFSCRLVGRGPDQDLLQRTLARLGLQNQVGLLGALAHDAILQELSRSDVLVAPSVPSSDGRREGIPVVLMEAMSCGIPVVASRLSGIPELVVDEHSGLLVTPGSAKEIAAALHRLANDPELRDRLGREGRRTVERDFDLHANAAQLVAMFAAAGAP